MTRFEQIVQILDNAVGGPSAPVSFHGAFWRGVTRNQFVAKKVFGLPLVHVGDGAGSNLVKALRGEDPFGADLPVPPPAASFNRMPSGRPPVPVADIDFIQKWIEDGCPEDDVAPEAALKWRKTAAPQASSRTDDIWFLDPQTGWAVNSDGNILKTADGGNSWTVQHSAPGVYLRCVGFANANIGWVGTLTRTARLFHTIDGGQTWQITSPLPANAPVAVCGISVVNDQVVFASGTNNPKDFPRFMKTFDGGATWTAQDMSAHASILIDIFFTDELRGWVVGGKADAPNPTVRDRIKPVVLQTFDGGATWTNRLAGQEASFPFGEWGWKIQFLNQNVGFVSLENFTAGAILRTNDGGVTWQRLPINDPQGNANLEGVGFIDENIGWVGGWGSEDFTAGFTSATTDGGQNWQNANEVGSFINRFRFFGNPVTVGYASGDTVYKYSAEPAPAMESMMSRGRPPRTLLPESLITATTYPVEIPLTIPRGTKRLTLHVWDRFGNDQGYALDEINPQPGTRVFHWAGHDAQGDPLTAGSYIVRAIADDVVASSIVELRLVPQVIAQEAVPFAMARQAARVPTRVRRRTIAALMASDPEVRDLDWLKDALQIATQLELSTLPPYLTARWTIKPTNDPVSKSIREIRGEEMLHFGLACNLLTAIGGTPLMADASVVPTYPGPLPGGVRPDVIVSLKRLSKEQARVFMDIEYPQGGPIALEAVTYNSIGEFYAAILSTFQALNPPLSLARQLEGPLGLFKVENLDDVKQAIELINLQGEGTASSPEENIDDLAHYYRFAEIYNGKRIVKDPATGTWSFGGPDVPLPDTWPMADIPSGGYRPADVPDMATWDLIATFDQTYSDMLRSLQSAWQNGDDVSLWNAVGQMQAMATTGRELVKKPKPDGSGNYGPCFRFVT